MYHLNLFVGLFQAIFRVKKRARRLFDHIGSLTPQMSTNAL